MKIPTPGEAWRVFRETLQRHGGGWKGLASVLARGTKVVRALGFAGLVRRITAAHERLVPLVRVSGYLALAQPATIENIQLRIGVMIHMYYPDLIEEFATALSHMPKPYTLMVSVVDESARDAVQNHLSRLPQLERLIVKVVPNRGRDIAPMLISFRDDILATDVFCHLHTKKSLYAGQEQTIWRRYLVGALLGSTQRLEWILGKFQANPTLGMVYPESFRSVPLWGHTWLGNAEWGSQLAAQLGFAIDASEYLDFPAGSMFWARSDALRPIFEMGLRLEAFPPEQGQTDGTLQHAIERLLPIIVRQQGQLVGILPQDDRLELAGEGERNRQAYFDLSATARIEQASIDANIVSFDLFDTLVLRPFLEPSGARSYLGHCVEKHFDIAGFAGLRTEAEAIARQRFADVDPDINAIYVVLEEMLSLSKEAALSLQQLELDLERRWLRTRQGVAEAMSILKHDMRVIAISDMYLRENTLRDLLPVAVQTSLQKIYVSCDTGWRKDDDQAWQNLPSVLSAAPSQWLHVGDNEHADVQRPEAMGFIHPVHILRPASLFSVVPALRSLRPTLAQRARWQDQLWLGLLANRFAHLADTSPRDLVDTPVIRDPETFGYTVLGPLVTDYLVWVARTAVTQGNRNILFFSREGHLLFRAFKRLQEAVPQLQDIEARYLLVSRRGMNTAAIRQLADLANALGSTYTGTLQALLDTRLGTDVVRACAAVLGEGLMQREVYLPDMQDELIGLLSPAESAILDVAASERHAYLAYWHAQVGENDRPIVADIGYAGNIQAQLARVTEQPLDGAYFALKAAASQIEREGGQAIARFYDERAQPSQTPVMQHHLLLESVLTAPQGQFSHFVIGKDNKLSARYRQYDVEPSTWEIIERVHTGVEHFLRDAIDAVGEDALHLDFDATLVQQPLHEIALGRWKTGEWARALVTEDLYSGRGHIAARPA